MTVQLNILDAIKERDSGIERAILHADDVCEGWGDKAFYILKEFIRVNGNSFLVEDVRLYAEAKGLPEPPSKRSWGSIILKASRAGIVKKNGYGITRNVKSHGTPASEWIRTNILETKKVA